jgi:hypothetical protein
MSAKTKPTALASAITTENQLVVAIADAMSVEGQATKKWRDIVAPGMIKVFKTFEGATQARDRLIERAITPNLGEPYKLALATTLPDTRSKTGKTIADQNAKAWKADQLPTWLADFVEAMPVSTAKEKADRTKAKRIMKTYKGYVELIQALKASARSQGKVQFSRICEYAWPKPKTAKPKTAKPKAEAETKPEDSKLNPRQTLVQLLNNAKAYAQKHEDLPSQVATIAAISKAIELLGS